MIAELASKIKNKLKNHWPPNLAIMDTSGNVVQSTSGRSIKDELVQEHGIYVIDAHKDVTAGRLKISSLLDPGNGKKPELYFTSNCIHTLRQIRHYIWDEWAYRRKEKLDPKERPLKRDDHLMDALRYVVMCNVIYRPPGFGTVRKFPEVKGKTGYF
jgi:hypothetical protein